MRKVIIFLIIFLGVYSSVFPTQELREEKSLHFIVNYNPEIEREYIREIIKEAEEFYRIITQEFYLIRENPWLWDERAKIFVARDKEEYKNSFPCPDWSEACVNYHQKVIYTYKNQKKFSSFLAHELAHIIFREYVGRNWHLPLWIDEGVAVYVESKYANPSLEKFLMKEIRRIIKEKKYINFDKINSIFLGKNANKEFVNVFYIQAWSMVNFLRERFGKIKFKEYLNQISKGKDSQQMIFSTYSLIDNNEDFERLWRGFYLK